MILYPKSRLPIVEVRKFILIFYLVGILGFLIPVTRDLFVGITPYALVLNSYLLFIYHSSYTRKTILIFLLIFAIGFLVELIGVNTGLIFGKYVYGRGLGVKVLEVPVLIGVNWLFLTYTTVSITKSMGIGSYKIMLVAPLLMLVYDFILEQVAPKIDMWSWNASTVPLRNYFAWYIIGLCLSGLFVLFKVDSKNPLAAVLFTCQFIFFVFLHYLLK